MCEFFEADLRDAFREGWKTRNKNPGYRKVAKGTLGNFIIAACGPARYLDYRLAPVTMTYHNSLWALSSFRKDLKAALSSTGRNIEHQGFTLADVRQAFMAGWKQRNRMPGLNRQGKPNKPAAYHASIIGRYLKSLDLTAAA